MGPANFRRGRLIAIEGPSAVGKTTVGRALAAHLGAVFVPESFDQMRPKPSLRYRSRRELIELERTLVAADGLRYRKAARLRDRGATVVADTGFFGPLAYSVGLSRAGLPWDVVRPVQVECAARLSTGQLGLPDHTFYLAAGARELAERAARDPAGHPTSLLGRHWRVAPFERQFLEGLGPRRLTVIPADGSLESIVLSIAGIWKRAWGSGGHRRTEAPGFADSLALLSTALGTAVPEGSADGFGNR